MEIDEDGTCPYCRNSIPEDARADHERGVDTKRLECPHQDLEEIASDAETASQDIANRIW